jgi:membrane protease YdiL (CAAX protease family)
LTVAHTRALPSDWRETTRSAVPLGLLALAAAFPALRVPVLVALAAGTAVAINRDAMVRWTWAAGLPVAISLAWGVLPAQVAAASGADCGSLSSPIAIWRAAEAVIVLAGLAVLASALKASRSSLALRMPDRAVVRWSILAFFVAGPLALLLGPLLARPFVGDVSYDITVVGALAPAMLFAVANGSMEELAYRGALLGWSAKVIGVWPAVVGQAVVFGLAHSGADVVGNGVPLMFALGVGGLIAGVIAVRTHSLLLPMAIHIGLDIPIYYALACPN